MIPGYKPFFKTHPVANVANIQPETDEKVDNTPRISNLSKGSQNENTNTDSLIERSAIREHDAGFDRDSANMAASRHYDRQRQSYEYANPDGNPAMVEALYAAYIQDWQPDGPDDLPATPPNTRKNADLWRAWWAKVEEAQS